MASRQQRLAEEECARQRKHLRRDVLHRRRADEVVLENAEEAVMSRVAREFAEAELLRRRRAAAMKALTHASAVAVQRVWRGRCARRRCASLRLDIAASVRAAYEEEVAEAERVYLETHLIARAKLRLQLWLRRRAGRPRTAKAKTRRPPGL